MCLVLDLVLLAGPFQAISANSEGESAGCGSVGDNGVVVLCVVGGVLGGSTKEWVELDDLVKESS